MLLLLLLLLLLPSLFWASLQCVSIFVCEPFEYCHSVCIVLGAFEKLRKPTISFVLPPCLSVCPSALNNSAPTGCILMIFHIYLFFENPLKKSKFNCNLPEWLSAAAHRDVWKIMAKFLRIPLRMRNVSDTVGEKHQNTWTYNNYQRDALNIIYS